MLELRAGSVDELIILATHSSNKDFVYQGGNISLVPESIPEYVPMSQVMSEVLGRV